jgi:hypothetical protein
MNQSKPIVFILEIDLALLHFSQSLSQISDNEISTEALQVGEALKIHPGRSWYPRLLMSSSLTTHNSPLSH